MHLFILIGPSAAGKTTVMERVLANSDLELVRFPTTTTRDPREGEVQGVHYQFVSPKTFHALANSQQFFEWTEIYGHLYGTNKETLTLLRQGSRPIICVLEPEGARKIKETDPEHTTIVLITATRDTLIARLTQRHTDQADVTKRLERIDRELSSYPLLADVTIENKEDHLEETIAQIEQLISDRTRLHLL